MPLTRTLKTNFTAGEVSPRLLGRGDLRAYDNGALQLENIFIFPTGGITRRAGLRYIDTALGNGRLVPFEFNTEQNYLLVVTHQHIAIYLEDTKIADITAPWTYAQLAQISWTQSADTLLLCHPDVAPQRLNRLANGSWQLTAWVFESLGSFSYQPYYKFVDSAISLSPAGTTGSITLTASANVFVAGHVGTRIRLWNGEVQVTTVASPSVITAVVTSTLTGTGPALDWREQVFSPVRGWPVCVCFHQNRLVIGGSRDLPNRLWMSESNNLFNFDQGTGLDDNAIEFGILSDQVNAIRAVFSGRDLQVFTSGAEYMVSGTPLTPSNIQINRQTRIGSLTNRWVAPLDVDGATLFLARNGQEVREFLYTNLEQAYTANDLSLLSSHLLVEPIEMDFDKARRLLFVVRGDGTFCTLTLYRAEEVVAWTHHSTNGTAQSVCVVGDVTYLLVARDGSYFVERFDDNLQLDNALTGTSVTAAAVWSGLTYLNGKTVTIVADGAVRPDAVVTGGHITLDPPAHNVQIGLPYTHTIKPLPPNTAASDGSGARARLVDLTLRLVNTAALTLDAGLGLRDIALRLTSDANPLDAALPQMTGDITIKGIGWQRDLSVPLWEIAQATPLPFTLLSVGAVIRLE